MLKGLIRKKNKHLMLHHLAPPGSCQMDIMFNSYTGAKDKTVRVAYLLLINIGTRKLYYAEINPKGPGKKGVKVIKTALEKVLEQAGNDFHVKIIRTDGESSFKSNEITEFLLDYGIIHEMVPIREGQASHTSLAIIDRVIRTLRDYAAMHFDERNIRPDVMKKAVDYYNNSPHSTLQNKLHKKGMTPNSMTRKDEEKLRETVLTKNQEVQSQKDFNLPIGTEVKVHRQPKITVFDKNDRIPVLRGTYRVTGREGAFYFVTDGSQTQKVSRYFLDPI